MNTVTDLGDYITSLGYADVQEFILQPDPDICVCLQPYGGLPSEGQFGSELPRYEFPRVQVLVRGEPDDATEPYVRAYALWRALHKQMLTINGTRYKHIKPLQSPFPLRKDTASRYEFAFNLDIDKDA